MDQNSYAPAVRQLLQLGKPEQDEQWHDYPAMGLTEAHVPDLIRLATDRSDFDAEDPSFWGPIHAWRALGQLRAAAAVEPLLGEFDWFDETDHEWGLEEVPVVLGMIGPPATDPAGRYIIDPAHHSQARVFAANALVKIGKSFPEQRAACVEHLQNALKAGEENEPDQNGFLVADLLDLKATEAAPAIQSAYAKGWVDRWICGDWEDVRRELADLPPKPRVSLLDEISRRAEALRQEPESPDEPALPPAPRRSDHNRRRAERKRQRQARKKGRPR